MTCIRIPGGIMCINPHGRLKLGNKYVWVEFHEYCGPTFYRDQAWTKLYEPADENDPIWPLFSEWLKKYKAKRDKARAKIPRTLTV